MAIAVGFLGLAALAAGFAGLRARSTAKADLVFVKATAVAEGDINKFSITLQNKGSVAVSSPFILNIKLGEKNDVIHEMKVMNSPSANVKGSYENLESKDGSFDILIKNFNLKRGESTTITYWFAISEDYNSDVLPFNYTWDTTNVVVELNESNNYKGSLDIVQNGLVRKNSSASDATTTVVLPDLIVKDITFGHIVTSTNSLIFKATIKNVGNGNADASNSPLGSFAVQLERLERDSGEWVPVGVSGTFASVLNSGEETYVNSGVTLTNTSKVRFIVDSQMGTGYIMESNEDNNQLTKSIDQIVPVSNVSTSVTSSTNNIDLPDLIVKDFTMASSTIPGKTRISATIKNIGNVTAVKSGTSPNQGTFVLTAYKIDENDIISRIDGFLESGTFYTEKKLNPGQELTISGEVSLYFPVNKIKMKVDWLDSPVTSLRPFVYPNKGYILESNEDNNELIKEIRL